MYKKINYKEFLQEFLSTPIGKQVQNDFTYVTCNNDNWPPILEVAKRYKGTCRELLGNNNLAVVKNYTTLSIVSFFYLNMLQENSPTTIYDIGCGWNIWKKYIPNIIGVDSVSQYADIKEEYNNEYVSKNYRSFDAAFSINMNFGLKKNVSTNTHEATTFETLGDHLMEFSSIIKKGGRGYLAVPAVGLMKFTSNDWMSNNNLSCYDIQGLTDYTENLILNQNLKIIALDLELDILRNLPGHDGEVRIVFEV
jgi:hypothetical protein